MADAAAGRFARVPEWLLYSDVGDRAIRLYALLQRYARGGAAWPAKQTLAGHLRCGVRSVEGALAELVTVGAVAITTPVGAPNRYRVFDLPTTVERPRPPQRAAEVDPATSATGCAGSAEPPQPAADHLRNGLRTTSAAGCAQKESQEGEPRRTAPSRAQREPAARLGRERRSDLLAAVAEAVGAGHPANWTATELTAAERVAAELADVGATPAVVRDRAAEYRRRWPTAALTTAALARHWSGLAHTTTPKGGFGGAGPADASPGRVPL